MSVPVLAADVPAARPHPWHVTCCFQGMRPQYFWAALLAALSATLFAPSAVADANVLFALCPVGESSARAAPTCMAVHLLSKRGYLVLPGTRVFLGVGTERVNLMVRLAAF